MICEKMDLFHRVTLRKIIKFKIHFFSITKFSLSKAAKTATVFLRMTALLQGSKPTILRNHIHNSDQNGILIHSKGRGEILHNEIFNNKIDGVPLSSFAE